MSSSDALGDITNGPATDNSASVAYFGKKSWAENRRRATFDHAVGRNLPNHRLAGGAAISRDPNDSDVTSSSLENDDSQGGDAWPHNTGRGNRKGDENTLGEYYFSETSRSAARAVVDAAHCASGAPSSAKRKARTSGRRVSLGGGRADMVRSFSSSAMLSNAMAAAASDHTADFDEVADVLNVHGLHTLAEENSDDLSSSRLSAATSSIGNSEGDDIHNRSTLSDTTELTPSNFVFQATSRARLSTLSGGGAYETHREKAPNLRMDECSGSDTGEKEQFISSQYMGDVQNKDGSQEGKRTLAPGDNDMDTEELIGFSGLIFESKGERNDMDQDRNTNSDVKMGGATDGSSSAVECVERGGSEAQHCLGSPFPPASVAASSSTTLIGETPSSKSNSFRRRITRPSPSSNRASGLFLPSDPSRAADAATLRRMTASLRKSQERDRMESERRVRDVEERIRRRKSNSSLCGESSSLADEDETADHAGIAALFGTGDDVGNDNLPGVSSVEIDGHFGNKRGLRSLTGSKTSSEHLQDQCTASNREDESDSGMSEKAYMKGIAPLGMNKKRCTRLSVNAAGGEGRNDETGSRTGIPSLFVFEEGLFPNSVALADTGCSISENNDQQADKNAHIDGCVPLCGISKVTESFNTCTRDVNHGPSENAENENVASNDVRKIGSDHLKSASGLVIPNDEDFMTIKSRRKGRDRRKSSIGIAMIAGKGTQSMPIVPGDENDIEVSANEVPPSTEKALTDSHIADNTPVEAVGVSEGVTGESKVDKKLNLPAGEKNNLAGVEASVASSMQPTCSSSSSDTTIGILFDSISGKTTSVVESSHDSLTPSSGSEKSPAHLSDSSEAISGTLVNSASKSRSGQNSSPSAGLGLKWDSPAKNTRSCHRLRTSPSLAPGENTSLANSPPKASRQSVVATTRTRPTGVNLLPRSPIAGSSQERKMGAVGASPSILMDSPSSNAKVSNQKRQSLRSSPRLGLTVRNEDSPARRTRSRTSRSCTKQNSPSLGGDGADESESGGRKRRRCRYSVTSAASPSGLEVSFVTVNSNEKRMSRRVNQNDSIHSSERCEGGPQDQDLSAYSAGDGMSSDLTSEPSRNLSEISGEFDAIGDTSKGDSRNNTVSSEGSHETAETMDIRNIMAGIGLDNVEKGQTEKFASRKGGNLDKVSNTQEGEDRVASLMISKEGVIQRKERQSTLSAVIADFDDGDSTLDAGERRQTIDSNDLRDLLSFRNEISSGVMSEEGKEKGKNAGQKLSVGTSSSVETLALLKDVRPGDRTTNSRESLNTIDLINGAECDPAKIPRDKIRARESLSSIDTQVLLDYRATAIERSSAKNGNSESREESIDSDDTADTQALLNGILESPPSPKTKKRNPFCLLNGGQNDGAISLVSNRTTATKDHLPDHSVDKDRKASMSPELADKNLHWNDIADKALNEEPDKTYDTVGQERTPAIADLVHHVSLKSAGCNRRIPPASPSAEAKLCLQSPVAHEPEYVRKHGNKVKFSTPTPSVTTDSNPATPEMDHTPRVGPARNIKILHTPHAAFVRPLSTQDNSESSSTSPTEVPSSSTRCPAPKSILNSNRKRLAAATGMDLDELPKKTVAFGSPEAAEYNLGSPSVSMTPMPAGMARALFSIPSKSSSESFYSSSSDSRLELSENSNSSSSLEASADLTKPVEPTAQIESDVNDLLANVVMMSDPSMNEKQVDTIVDAKSELIEAEEDVDSFSLGGPADHNVRGMMYNDSLTAELESGINALLQKTTIYFNQSNCDTDVSSKKSGPETSLLAEKNGNKELEKASGISTSSRCSPLKTISSNGCSLNCKTRPSRTDMEDTTVELEGDVTALLAKASDPALMSSIDQSIIDAENSLTMISSPGGDSVDMADAASLASAHSRPTDASLGDKSIRCDESPSRVKKLDFGKNPDYSCSPVLEERSSEVEKSDCSNALRDGGNGGFVSGIVPVANMLSLGKQKRSASSSQESSRSQIYVSELNTKELETGADSLLDKFGVNISSRSALTDSNRTSDSATIELEGDMAALVAIAETKKNNSFLSLRTSISEDSITESKGSYAGKGSNSKIIQQTSQQFAISPQTKIALQVENGRIVEKYVEHECSDERYVTASQSRVTLSEPAASLIPKRGEMKTKLDIVNVSWMEVCQAAKLFPSSETISIDERSVLLDACIKSSSQGNFATGNAVRDYLSEVCEEIEGRSDGASVCDEFEALMSGNIPEITELQRSIRIFDGRKQANHGTKALQSLAASLRDHALSEWTVWETQVADALRNRIMNVADGVDDDERNIERHLHLAEETYESISLMAGRAARKARRRSIRRRKTAASKLEDEILGLQNQVEEAIASLEAQNDCESDLQMKAKCFEVADSARASVNTNYDIAKSKRDKLVQVEGLVSWALLTVNTSEIALEFSNSAKESSLVLQFNFGDSAKVPCSAKLTNSSSKRTKRMKPPRYIKCDRGIVAFVRQRNEFLCKATRRELIKTRSDIVSLLQRIDCELCRLEIVAREISLIKSRFEAEFERAAECKGDGFNLRVIMHSHDEKLSLDISFLINSGYPYCPLEMTVDQTKGNLNLQALQRQVTKTAKPGFGYLSRTLDVIGAFVKCS